MNFKAQKRKTNTNPEPYPIQNASTDPYARIQFTHCMATPQKMLHRVTIRSHSQELVGWVGLGQIDGLNRRSNCLLNKQIARQTIGTTDRLGWDIVCTTITSRHTIFLSADRELPDL